MKSIVNAVAVYFCLSFTSVTLAQTDTSKFEKALQFEVSYIGDNLNSIYGGKKNGSVYLGMANIRALFDTEKIGLLNGNSLYVNAVNTHGATPSSQLLGDLQVASNIEAGNHTYLQELWVKQKFKKIEFTLGLQDLNVDFANSENGALFVNSSFGILPVVSANVPAPIFPLTSLGFLTKWKVNENTNWLGAIYDGSPTNFDYNPYNLNWRFASGDGILAITELQKKVLLNSIEGTYKIGIYTHNHFVESKLNSNFPDSLNHTTYGIYFYADQQVWQKNGKGINSFAQFGYSPSQISLIKSYVGFGLNFSGILNNASSDILGLAFAHANLASNLGSETLVELTYQRQVTSNLYIQPDLQYILTPSGKSSNIRNCLVCSIRFGLLL